MERMIEGCLRDSLSSIAAAQTEPGIEGVGGTC